jgi:hypothetical protein
LQVADWPHFFINAAATGAFGKSGITGLESAEDFLRNHVIPPRRRCAAVTEMDEKGSRSAVDLRAPLRMIGLLILELVGGFSEERR